MRSKRWAALAVAVLLVFVGCSSDDNGIQGVYTHPEEGKIEIKDDGVAVFSQEGSDPATGSYTQNGDTITFKVNDNTAKAEATDDKLVFEKGAYSGDEETTFTKKD